MSNWGKCSKCRADVIWVRTRAGKNMPCDPTPVTYWQDSKGKGRVITPNGETIACRFEGDMDKATGWGYIPHWGTCPNRRDFKK